MDPTITLRNISFALIEGNETEASDACTDLYAWIANKCFEPDWARYPDATQFYRQYAREINAK